MLNVGIGQGGTNYKRLMEELMQKSSKKQHVFITNVVK